MVNSFHQYVIEKKQMSPEFFEILSTEDDCVESFVHKELPIIGVIDLTLSAPVGGPF